jgi:hypothetical protein
MRQADVQADALAFVFAHEFVEERYHESDLTPGLEHHIQYPTRAPISGHYIDRNQVVESVLFATLADLHLRRIVPLAQEETDRVWGSRGLYRWLNARFGYRRRVLYATLDGSLPPSPLCTGLEEVFASTVRPEVGSMGLPRLPVAQLLRKLLALRGRDQDPYKEIIRWVGDELIEEGYYVESTDVVVGAVPFSDIHPDVEKMLTLESRAMDLKARLERFRQRDPELAEALKQTVTKTMQEQQTLFQRRTGF